MYTFGNNANAAADIILLLSPGKVDTERACGFRMVVPLVGDLIDGAAGFVPLVGAAGRRGAGGRLVGVFFAAAALLLVGDVSFVDTAAGGGDADDDDDDDGDAAVSGCVDDKLIGFSSVDVSEFGSDADDDNGTAFGLTYVVNDVRRFGNSIVVLSLNDSGVVNASR